jgi:uncharacterized membrane protein
MATIRNPIEWGADQIVHAAHHLEAVGHSLRGADAGARSRHPEVCRIRLADLRGALSKGFADLGAYRTDVVFLCLIYPVVGLVLARFALHSDLLPLLFPAASGFALLGPAAAVGLYEMSRRREQGLKASWADAFAAVRSPSFGAIVVLGLLLLAIFLAWLGVADLIYTLTLGPESPVSAAAFIRDVFTTDAGWTMTAVGMGIGFLFAVLVLAISVVSFPLLLDRDVGLGAAIATSVRAVKKNPGPMAVWGLIVAGALALGTLPLFLGLIIVMPVLGHATWHLYRKVVAPPAPAGDGA